MYYAYILQSETSGRFYIGSTEDLDKRIAQHNNPDYKGSKTTKNFPGPWKLMYYETFETRSEALKRERQIKSWKDRRAILRLIKSQVVI